MMRRQFLHATAAGVLLSSLTSRSQCAETTRTSYLFHNGRLLDPRLDELVEGVEVLVEGDQVKEVWRSDNALPPNRAHKFEPIDGVTRVDLGGRTLMPGLIDAHVHIFISKLPLAALESMPLTLAAVNASAVMRKMLMRGFTTVRDTAGGDYGMKAACDSGLVEGPRLFISGMAMSQTGGHGDFRRLTQGNVECPCCAGLYYLTRIVDGVPEMLKAVRDELRKGADHIKLMVSGGVASQNDPLDSLQFRIDEIEAACQEAQNWGKYVSAHAYSAAAIRRAVNCGVRTIEHGNFIDEPVARLMAEKNAFLVPTLITYRTMAEKGQVFGLPEISQRKNEEVLAAGLKSVQIAKRAGVQIGFGTDLLGPLHDEQSREFLIRFDGGNGERPIDIIRSATLVNARLVQHELKLGEIVPGAFADLLVVDGNPLRDLELFQDQGAHFPAIMKRGVFYKNRLHA
jgi:imidazolonepropionase-like amidohydrolase